MENLFLGLGIALALFAFWAIARHDWLRLTRPSRRITAEVVSHRINHDDGSESYAAIWRFTAEGGTHEVIDRVYSASRQPPVGALRELAYPEGRPDLAQLRRPLMWTAIYAFLLFLLVILSGRMLGYIPG